MEDIKYHNTNIENIVDYLGSCFPGSCGNFSDVEITCRDGQISAHKLVLASISQMLYLEFKQNTWDDTLSIVLPDFSLPEVTTYLKSVYTCEDISKYSIFNQMIGSIETEEIEIDNKYIKSEIETEEIEIHKEEIKLDIENVIETDFDNKEIFSSPEDVNGDPIEEKAKMINIIKVKKSKKGAVKKLKKGTEKGEKRYKNERSNYKTERSLVWQYFTLSSDDSKVVFCNICSKQFSKDASGRTTTLLDHLFNAHDIQIKFKNKDRSWKCPSCTRVLASEKKLNEHILRQHSEVGPCAYCGKIISGRVAKKRHEDQHRAIEERKFACDICSKAFIDNDALKRHKMTHSGLKPYQVEFI